MTLDRCWFLKKDLDTYEMLRSRSGSYLILYHILEVSKLRG